MNKVLQPWLRWVVYPVLVAVLVVAFDVLCCFSSVAVCSECGALREMREWQVPVTRITLFRHSVVRETPVSEVLMSSGVVPPHEHHWLFGYGGGNGVLCAIGEGRHLYPVVESKRVGVLLGASQNYGERAFGEELKKELFDPKSAEAVRWLEMSVPANGFADGAAFRAWLGLEREGFRDNVAIFRGEFDALMEP